MKQSNWITFPDGYSCNLNSVRTITKLQVHDKSCSITIRFDGSDKTFYEWEFPFADYCETKEELIQKVEKLRERLVMLANNEEAPLRATTLIDLKKSDIVQAQ